MTKKRARATDDDELVEQVVLDRFRRALSAKVGSFAEREAAALALADELCRADRADQEKDRDLGAATQSLTQQGTDDEDSGASGE
jgi:hypothetical protein